MKSDDRRSSGPERETIWSELVISEPPHQEAFSVINYFVEKMEHKSRWFELGKSQFNK